MKTLVLVLALLALVITSSAFAGVVTQWDYNWSNSAPSIGVGYTTGRGNITNIADKWDVDTADPGTLENNSSDPNHGVNPGKGRAEWGKNAGWSLTATPGEQAIIWHVSTAGLAKVVVSMDVRMKPYNPKYFQLQYSTDGTNFTTFPTIYESVGMSGGLSIWQNGITMDLSNITAVNNCPNFAFAFIKAYGPGASAYEPAQAGTTMESGKYGYDMVTVNAVPEPGTFVALGSGLLGLIGFARRRTH